MESVTILLLLLSAPVHGILPDIHHVLGELVSRGPSEDGQTQVEVDTRVEEQLQRETQELNNSVTPAPSVSSSPAQNQSSENVIGPVSQSPDTNTTSTSEQPRDLDNNILQGCFSDEDCGQGRFCFSQNHRSKCLSCKALDVPCSRDVECCGGHLCVWGQCTDGASKGEAGSTCQTQSDCSPDLCCAFHKVLLFPICLSKPIEREQCFSASNHLMELLSPDPQDERPRKHCPCVGDLHCQHLGRGSMCLRQDESSEEETDDLYSHIDYII